MGLSSESVRRILVRDLTYHPYKLMVTQELLPTDYAQCLAFQTRLISRLTDFNWPRRSPDLTVSDFFLWGYLKSRVYTTKPRDLEELKTKIHEEILIITLDMQQKVYENFVERLRDCVAQRGHHLGDVIFHK